MTRALLLTFTSGGEIVGVALTPTVGEMGAPLALRVKVIPTELLETAPRFLGQVTDISGASGQGTVPTGVVIGAAG